MLGFGTDVLIAVSETKHGSMSKGVSEADRNTNRRRFLQAFEIQPEQTALVYLTYEREDFCRFTMADDALAGDGMIRRPSVINDGLFTTTPGLALLLPVADCVGVVLYDPVHRVLGLVHLGRHNLEQKAGTEAIRYMQDAFGTVPAEIRAYLGPAAGSASYPLHGFDNRSLHEVATEQLTMAGLREAYAMRDERDTTSDPGLFSHSEFLQGRQESDGRQAIVAMLRP